MTTPLVLHDLPGPATRLLTAVPSGDQAVTIAELADVVRRLGDLDAGLDGALGPATPAAEPLRLGRLCLDPGSYLAVVDGAPVDLTAREFQLLWELSRSTGQLVTVRGVGYRLDTG